MKSIAIWWDNKELTTKIHLDINLWRRDDQQGSYIEIGIKILEGEPNNIYIDLPLKIIGQFEDMSQKIDINVGQVLFNDQISLTSENGRIKILTLETSEKKFNLCELTNDRIKLEDCDDGRGRITISYKDYVEEAKKQNNSTNPFYFRFRIKSASRIYETKNENYFYLDGLLRRTAILDLNINSPRKLPNTLVTDIKEIQFESINMFLISAGIIGFEFQSEPLKRSRILEDKGWDKYNPYLKKDSILRMFMDKLSNLFKLKKQDYVAYHWKQNDPFKEYSLFLKFTFSTKKLWAIFIMITIIIFLGTTGGVLGNFVTTKYFNSFQDTNCSIKRISE